MSSFRLAIKSHLIGSMVFSGGEGWLVRISDSIRLNDFFDWLEGRKYFPGDSIEYETDHHKITGVSGIGRYAGILRFRLSDNEGSEIYYQQRYHATENDTVETVREYTGPLDKPYFRELAIKLGADRLWQEKINMLSTGEFRKVYALKAALLNPSVMFIEEPYTGIDPVSTEVLDQVFAFLINKGTTIVIFTSGNRRPGFIGHYINISGPENENFLSLIEDMQILQPGNNLDFKNAFKLSHLTARYDGREVLQNINWSVKCHDKWKLTGRNGAGKSTLLSIVNADNPQAYNNTVYVFDTKRGSGESIWDIKDRIGFYSTELHRYFDKHQTVEEAIHSIVFLNPYRKRQLTPSEENFMNQVMKYFHLSALKNKSLYDLSSEFQKLVLITAALIKNAPLLILDEPFQGFSESLALKARALIDRYVLNRTFIMVSHNNTDFPDCINRHYHLENGTGSEVADSIH